MSVYHTPPTFGRCYHIKLKYPPTMDASMRERLKLFHGVLVEVDSDWPFAHIPEYRGEGTKKIICGRCGGRLYNSPMLKREEIEAIAHQLGVNVKVESFVDSAACMAKQEERDA